MAAYPVLDVGVGGRPPAHAHPLLGTHYDAVRPRSRLAGRRRVDAIPYLIDHIVHGQAVMPTTGFAEIALATGCEALGLPADRVAVNRVEVEQMLRLDGQTHVTATPHATGDDAGGDDRVEIHSRSADGNWRRHAVATVRAVTAAAPTLRPAHCGRCRRGTIVAPADLYAGLRRTGLHLAAQAFAADAHRPAARRCLRGRDRAAGRGHPRTAATGSTR